MKKTIHDISEFNFPSKEKFLRRDYKNDLSRAKVEAIRYTLVGLVLLLAVVLFAYNALTAATARATSVLLYDNVRVQAVMNECEAYVRGMEG